jgi:hypothetical protein
MRKLLVFCIFFHFVDCSAFAQEKIDSSATQKPAPVVPAPQRTAPRPTAPRQGAPQQELPPIITPQERAAQQAEPKPDPFMDDPAPSPSEDLNLDSNQSFNFNDSANIQPSNTSNLQSSIASNSNFRGASPQMIGDFGGGSLMKSIRGTSTVPANLLTFPIPLAGGSRRIKIAENNQVMPEDRVYGTFNYFHNAYKAIGTGANFGGSGPNSGDPITIIDSESLSQYTVGFEKKFCAWGTPFSIDVRMPFTGGVNQSVFNHDSSSPNLNTSAEVGTRSMGNLSTAFKIYLLKVKQTSISGGLGMSLPTGSSTHVETSLPGVNSVNAPVTVHNIIDLDNSAVHLMPFLGAYRQIGNSSWLQAFTQIDVATSGNKGRQLQFENFNLVSNESFSLNEQNLLYADVSLGKWWYRKLCRNRECQCRRRGLTGVASILELHYTGSLNDADPKFSEGDPNRFSVLNLTTGLMLEFHEQLRVNLAGVFPLRERRFDENGRREDRFFDGEFSLQVNYLY